MVLARFLPHPASSADRRQTGEKNKVIPLNFQWGGRIYDNLRLNLVYKERQGRTTLTYFCVDDGVNYFKLSFNGESLEWRVEESN